MLDGVPPVTRARTLRTGGPDAGPLNVADSPAARSNWRKLWNRFGPWRCPRSGVTAKFGPASVRAGPTVPSVATAAPAGPASARERTPAVHVPAARRTGRLGVRA